MAPVVKALAASGAMRPVICLTGQHRDMLAGILDFFGLTADHDLSIMQPEQDLVYVTTAVLTGVQRVLAAEQPGLGPGARRHHDGAGGRSCRFYAGCRIGHVEAGLRTGDMRQPWPEEMNRSVIDRLADRLFAPTERARQPPQGESGGRQDRGHRQHGGRRALRRARGAGG